MPAYSSTGFSELCAYLDHDLKKEQALRKMANQRDFNMLSARIPGGKKSPGLEILDAADPELLEKAWSEYCYSNCHMADTKKQELLVKISPSIVFFVFHFFSRHLASGTN